MRFLQRSPPCDDKQGSTREEGRGRMRRSEEAHHSCDCSSSLPISPDAADATIAQEKSPTALARQEAILKTQRFQRKAVLAAP